MTPGLHATITRDLTAAGAEITGLWGGQLPDTIARLWQP